jgi:putative ABC transport system permease protein
MIHRLPWRQLTYEKLRLLAAGAGITFAVLLQLMQFGFRDALYTSSVLVHTRLLADLVITSAQYEYIVSTGTFPRRRLYEAQMFKQVESVGSMQMGIVPFRDPVTRQDHQVLLLALSPDNPAFDLALLNADPEKIRIADAVLFDGRSRSGFLPVIERVRREGAIRTDMAGRRIEIAGLFDLGVSFSGNAHMITSDSTFRQIMHRSEGSTDVGLVRLRPGSDIDAVRTALAAALPPDVKIMTRQQFADLERGYWNRNSPIGFIFNLAVLVGLLVGAVIVYHPLHQRERPPSSIRDAQGDRLPGSSAVPRGAAASVDPVGPRVSGGVRSRPGTLPGDPGRDRSADRHDGRASRHGVRLDRAHVRSVWTPGHTKAKIRRSGRRVLAKGPSLRE